MFFLKPKPKIDEILPPPPPEAEFEEQSKKDKEEPNLFEETTENIPEEKEFGDLTKDLKKAKITKKQKTPKKITLKKYIPVKTTKDKSLQPKKTILKKPIKTVKKEAKKIEAPKSKENLPEDKEFEDLFKEVKALKPKEVKKEIELPETLEDLDIEDFGKDLGVEKSIDKEQEIKEKPTEILEAEEEIKSAIDKIKKQEKTSFFKRLFSRKEKAQEKPIEEHLMPELPEVNQISIIQNSINKAKDALIKFDLEAAKKNYIEIMKIYNTIKPEEQSKVYHDIKDLYFERKSAEGLKA